MRRYTIPESMEVEYILTDHLCSSSITTDATGKKISQTNYKPWGEIRGVPWTDQETTAAMTDLPFELIKRTFTGQYSYMGDFGLHFYNARWYDSSIGRFAQADTIIPGGAQGLDRYAYVSNNPVNRIDPSGHWDCGNGYYTGCMDDKGSTFGSGQVRDVALNAKGLALAQFVDRKNVQRNDDEEEIDVMDVAQMGFAGELAGWGASNAKSAKWYTQLVNRYAWWVNSACHGVNDQYCLVNFLATQYQSVMSVVRNYAGEDDGLPTVSNDYGPKAFKKAGQFVSAFNAYIEAGDFSNNPETNPNTQNDPFSVGVLSKGFVKKRLWSLTGPDRRYAIGKNNSPTQGSAYYQALVVDEVYEYDEKAKKLKLIGYSVVFSWCQELWWKSHRRC